MRISAVRESVERLSAKADEVLIQWLVEVPRETLRTGKVAAVATTLRKIAKGLRDRYEQRLNLLPYETRKAIEEFPEEFDIEATGVSLQRTLAQSGMGEPALSLVENILIGHQRFCAKMHAVLAEKQLWKDPQDTGELSENPSTGEDEIVLGDDDASAMAAMSTTSSSLDLGADD